MLLRLATTFSIVAALLVTAAAAQTPQTPQQQSESAPAENEQEQTPVIALPISVGDEVDINVFGAPDLTTHQGVDGSGRIMMPLAGPIHIAGLNSSEASAVIEKRLRDGGYMLDPHVTVFVKQYSAASVAILGEVQKPGIYPIVGPHRLWDLLLAAGGLTDKAGTRILLRHKGSDDATALPISSDPEKALNNNIDIQAGDSIVVTRAGIVYVIGEVNQAAGYSMSENNSVSVLEALAKAHGPNHDAALNRSCIVRKNASGESTEIRIPLKDMLAAKKPDLPMQDGDILFVPGVRGRYAAQSGIQTLMGIAAAAALHF